MASVLELLHETLDDLEEDKLKRFKSILRHDGPIPASKLEKADVTDTVDKMLECFEREGAVKITINILRKMNQNQLAEQLEMKHSEVIQRDHFKPVEKQTEDFALNEFLKSHRTNMKEKAEHIFEGKKENEALLKDVYTELFITEGDVERVNEEHEILKIDDAFKSPKSEDRSISCNEIFNLLLKNNKKKIILTKGIAGIGKTVSVHKFILDWAEGKSNQDISCMFLLPFREINFVKDKEFNLHEFLLVFYPELKEVDKAKLYKSCNLAFIFDGLDESRLPLHFESGMVSSIEERSTVDELFTNLVRGNLLPSALIWVTSRPAAANQIPPEFVGLYMEVRGFTDKHKEEYFRNRFKDEAQASDVIVRIKTSRSLYIMCYIPVFCWITATVLKETLIKNDTGDVNTTLTEMYIHFLLIQMNMKNRKYDRKSERVRTKLLESNKAMILKLAKLAFEQLKQKNTMFYEEELRECGIDVNEDSEGTGMLTEIFKTEAGLHEMKVFCFVHLSVQEFLAALHVFLCYLNKNMEELSFFFKEKRAPVQNLTLHEFLREAVNKTVQSKTGHFDLFLRFLLGISLESNQKLLKGLLTHTEDSAESVVKTTNYIKKQIHVQDISAEVSVNLFYCLLELKDSSLWTDIHRYLNSEAHPGGYVPSSMCSVLVYVLLMSEKVLDEFDVKMYNTSDYKRLLPAVRCCVKAQFGRCGLDEACCEIVSSALQSPNCPLIELDLSDNDLKDSGVMLISDALKSSHCQLKILRLAMCGLSAECCESLASALGSLNCPLRDLELSNNDLQVSGVKLISAGLKSSHCQLEILRLSGCMVTEEGCFFLDSALNSNPSHLRELDLSYNHPGYLGVQRLFDKLNDPNYKLEILNVDNRGEFRITTGLHKYAINLTLDPNTAHPDLALSEGNTKVTKTTLRQSYPDHPERFDKVPQILCRESLTGRCYWETEWCGWRRTEISVTYKGIERKGWTDNCELGHNEKSWSSHWSDNSFSARHNKKEKVIRLPENSGRRVGVYLDWTAGVLSFYSFSKTHEITHIHTFKNTFTEPLYAAFRVFTDHSVSLRHITLQE
ncbi:protein NLRC3 [Paramisgurnus dabryanus]|uniref:protein NLRC3 n=1 Tax=Paramisgurnus dabryanus TaxID=90735 RepID=UPI0031F3D86C